jgi:hypothetical protein
MKMNNSDLVSTFVDMNITFLNLLNRCPFDSNFSFIDEFKKFKRSYKPSYQDVLKIRRKTVGVCTGSFEKIDLIDTGGQINER